MTAKISPSPARVVALLGGILVVMLGLGLLGNELTSLGWRLKALLFYKEGTARVLATEIYKREGVFELETTHRLEWDGHIGKRTATLDRDDPWVSTREEALARQSRIVVGKLYPCWYAPGAPEAENVFAPDGLHFGPVLGRAGVSVVVIGVGAFLVAWTLRGLGVKAKSRRSA